MLTPATAVTVRNIEAVCVCVCVGGGGRKEFYPRVASREILESLSIRS